MADSTNMASIKVNILFYGFNVFKVIFKNYDSMKFNDLFCQ
jgi:hypothetical protein